MGCGGHQSMGHECWEAGTLGQGSGWTNVTTEAAPFSVSHRAEWLSLLCAFVLFSIVSLLIKKTSLLLFMACKAPHLPPAFYFIVISVKLKLFDAFANVIQCPVRSSLLRSKFIIFWIPASIHSRNYKLSKEAISSTLSNHRQVIHLLVTVCLRQGLR